MWWAVLVMLLAGLAIGVFQGFWIAKIRVPAFIATLAGMYAFRGIASAVLGGQRGNADFADFLRYFGVTKSSYITDFMKDVFPNAEKTMLNKDGFWVALLPGTNFDGVKTFNVTCMCIGLVVALIFIAMRVRKILVQKKMNISQSIPAQVISTALISLLIVWVCFNMSFYRGFPMALVWVSLVLGIYAYITNKTAIGRHLYAVGGNEKATALSGVKTRNVYWFAYANIGLLAGLAGILTAGRAKGIDPVYGEGYEMDAIASCFIGGASAYGGTGKVSGMIIGAILMGVINKGMIIVGVDANYQKVVKGIVLLIAVMFDVLSKRQKR
jgi:putative multiple sugar transport system permease protein